MSAAQCRRRLNPCNSVNIWQAWLEKNRKPEQLYVGTAASDCDFGAIISPLLQLAASPRALAGETSATFPEGNFNGKNMETVVPGLFGSALLVS
jgi:hypothetical protein